MTRLLLFFFLFPATLFAQHATLNFRLDVPKDREDDVTGATTLIIDGRHFDTTIFVYRQRSFTFTDLSADTFNIRLRASGILAGDTAVYGIVLEPGTSLSLSWQWPPFCPYDHSGKKCPKCRRTDEVIPIVYGLLISPEGDPMENEGVDFRSGGCEITGCDPHWYCKRDDEEF